MTERATPFKLDFYRQRPLTVEFSALPSFTDVLIAIAFPRHDRLSIRHFLQPRYN